MRTLFNQGFQLSYQMIAAFPLKVQPKQGTILPMKDETFTITWSPTGAYDLRTSIKCETNIGSYEISVHGKGAYPRFSLSTSLLDFGECAIGHSYTQNLTINNRGIVPIDWSIPSQEHGYSISQEEGSIEPKRSHQLRVTFSPSIVQPYPGSLIVECRGRFREVQLHGIGGRLALQHANQIEMGPCAAGCWTSAKIALLNTGDVPVQLKKVWVSAQLPPGFRCKVSEDLLAKKVLPRSKAPSHIVV
jgi:hypothetical protein